MLQTLFHAWERRLASVTDDRVVRPFEWGLDWIAQTDRGLHTQPAEALTDWVSQAMADTDAFFFAEPTSDYTFDAQDDDRDASAFRARWPHRIPKTTRSGADTFRLGIARDEAAAAALPCSCCRSGTRMPRATSDSAVCSPGTA